MSHTVSWYFLFVSCNQDRNLSCLKREGIFQGPRIRKEKLTEPKKHDKVTLPWPQAFKEWTVQDRPSVGPLHLGRSPTINPGHSIWRFMQLGAPSKRQGLLWVKWPHLTMNMDKLHHGSVTHMRSRLHALVYSCSPGTRVWVRGVFSLVWHWIQFLNVYWAPTTLPALKSPQKDYWGTVTQPLLWRDVQSSWEGDRLINNQRIKQGDPRRCKSQTQRREGSGKTKVIRRGFMKGAGLDEPLGGWPGWRKKRPCQAVGTGW